MIKKLLSAISLIILSVILVSCNTPGTDSTPDNDFENNENEDIEVTPPVVEDQVNENAVWGKGINLRVVIKDGSDIDTTDFIYSVSELTDTAAILVTDVIPATAHEFIIGDADRDITRAAYDKLNEIIDPKEEDGWLIYTENSSVAAVYTSKRASEQMWNFIKNEFYTKAELVFDENRIISSNVYNLKDTADTERENARAEAYNKIEKEYGKDVSESLKKLYTLYGPEIYHWIADLYDPGVGGFYFSNTGRDNIGYLPDLESTAQALSHLNTAGMFSDIGGYHNAISDEMKASILNFAKSLQSSEDGYFYHPQWGYKNELVSDSYKSARLGRDLGWARSLIRTLGGKPYYDTPAGDSGELGAPGAKLTGRLSGSKIIAVSKVIASAGILPTHLQSIDAWKKYIDSLNIVNDPYMAGNTLAAQHNEISNAGDEYIDYLTSYLTEKQNPETGFWGNGISYNTMNGFMKLSHSFFYYKRIIPGIEKALDSTMEILLTPDTDYQDLHICNTYNTWQNFSLILDSAEKTDGENMASKLRAKLLEKAPELIDITYEKVKTHKRAEGGFSYFETKACNSSQAAPVACARSAESDVNGTGLSSTGIVSSIADVLGFKMVPMYVPADAEVFLRMIEYRQPIDKSNGTAAPKSPSLTGTRGNGVYYGDSEKYNSLIPPLTSTSAITSILGEDDRYLYFAKNVDYNTQNTQNYVSYYVDGINSGTKGLVLELDIAFGGFSNYTHPTTKVAGFQINFENGSDLHSIYFDGGNGKISTKWGTIVSGNNISLEESKWNNLRLETYEYNDNGTVTGVIKVFVNSIYACDILTADRGKTTSLEKISLVLRQFETDDWVAVDNLYVGTHEKSFAIGNSQ